MRITWVLLSLSFLFNSTWSSDTQTTASVTPSGVTATTVKPNTVPPALPDLAITDQTVVTANNVAVSGVPVTDGVHPITTVAAATDGANQNVVATQKPTGPPDLPPAVHTTGPVTAATTARSPTTVPPQPTVVPNVPPTTPRPISTVTPEVVTDVTATPAAPDVANTMTPPGQTSSSSMGSPTRPATAKTPEPAVTNKIPEVSTKLPAGPSTSGAPVTTRSATSSQTTDKVGGSHIVFTPTVIQADNKGGNKETVPTSQGPTAFRTTIPAKSPDATPSRYIPTTQPGAIDPVVRTSPPQTTAITTTSTTAPASPKKFIYSLLSEQETKEEEDLAKVCRLLMPNWLNGTCTLTWRHHNGKMHFDLVEINGKVRTSQAVQYYEEITKKPTDNRTLIAILASCGALLIMIVILAVCASHHRRPYHENQQHLTEELHTVENGYHDNPTLEVMEVQPEMQEKKVALNGEFNDSWIVPIDNLLKEDLPDEEDTHL